MCPDERHRRPGLVGRLLQHPCTRDLDIDDPATTARRRQILRTKPFLRRIYEEWYEALDLCLPSPPERTLEIGSGAGFFGEERQPVITSDILPVPGVDVTLDAMQLPFRSNSLEGIVMVNVLHHLPDVRSFLSEVTRCLRPDGVVAMIEPWVTRWSRLVYGRLHHEPFDPGAASWEFDSGGSLSSANGALPWIIFERDLEQFDREFPDLQLVQIRPMMPIRYLLSGGISLRSLSPDWSFGLWRGMEGLLQSWIGQTAMFALIVLRRCQDSDELESP